MPNVFMALVILLVVVSLWNCWKSGNEHYAPTPDCLASLQAYNNYQCTGSGTVTDPTKVRLLQSVMNSCPEGTVLGNYECDPYKAYGAGIVGGTQLSNRHPNFFPGKEWVASVKGTNPTAWGLYNYN